MRGSGLIQNDDDDDEPYGAASSSILRYPPTTILSIQFKMIQDCRGHLKKTLDFAPYNNHQNSPEFFFSDGLDCLFCFVPVSLSTLFFFFWVGGVGYTLQVSYMESVVIH